MLAAILIFAAVFFVALVLMLAVGAAASKPMPKRDPEPGYFAPYGGTDIALSFSTAYPSREVQRLMVANIARRMK